jgi:hypothetical protein
LEALEIKGLTHMKNKDTLETYEDIDDVYDQDFIEHEFEETLTEWRESNLYEIGSYSSD